MKTFINRKAEVAEFENYVESATSFCPSFRIYYSRPASGITSYFKHLVSKVNNAKEVFAFYIDASHSVSGSLSSQLIHQLKLASEQKDINSLFSTAKQNVKDRFNKIELTAAALEGIPFCGPFIRELIEQDNEYRSERLVEPSKLDHAPENLAVELLIGLLKRKSVIMFIDQINYLDTQSVSILKNTADKKFHNLHYICSLTATNTDDELQVMSLLENKIPFIYLFNYSFKNFKQPDTHFILEYSQHIKKDISYIEAAMIAQNSKGNIYKSLREINSEGVMDSSVLLAIEKEIIYYLYVAEQPLRLSDLYAICLLSKEILVFNDEHLESTVKHLVDKHLINTSLLADGDKLIYLSNHYKSNKPSLRFIDELRIGSRLFEYFKPKLNDVYKYSKIELLPLLYRLSKNQHEDELVQIIVEISKLALRFNTVEIAQKFIKGLYPERIKKYSDYLTTAVILFNLKEYSELVDLIESKELERFAYKKEIRFIYGISLNRVRKHVESENVFYELLQEGLTQEERVSIVIYLISGKLHQNQIINAKAIFEDEVLNLEKTVNYGYFLRNSASIFEANESIKILHQSIDCFTKFDDEFGLGSAYNNLAVNYLVLNNYKSAYDFFEKSNNVLSQMGTRHIGLLYNNLGIYYAKIGEFAKSKEYLDSAYILNNNSMPKLFCKINLALLQLYEGHYNKADLILQEINSDVLNHPVDRVRQKFFYNRLIVELFCNKNSYEDTLKQARNHPHREDPEGSLQQLETILNLKGKNNLLKHIRPCYLVYWYHNPLKSIMSDLVY